MSDRLIVTIPGTPDRSLSQNARVFWATRSRATKQARQDAYYAAYDACTQWPPLQPPLIIHAVIAWEKGRKRMDPQNAVGILKATVDGIADAIGVDDRHITVATVNQDRDPAGAGFIRVVIEQESA